MPRKFSGRVYWAGLFAFLAYHFSGCNVNDPGQGQDPALAPDLPPSLMKNLKYGIKVSDTSSGYVFSDAYPHKLDMNDSALRKSISGKRLLALFTINNLPVRYKYRIRIDRDHATGPETRITAVSIEDSSWHQIASLDSSDWGADRKTTYEFFIQDSLVYTDSIEIIAKK